MRINPILIILQTLSIIGFILFPQSYFGLIYLIGSMLFLPSLISKVIFLSSGFGVKTAFSFLYFPFIYLIGYLLAYFLKIDLHELLSYFNYINIFLFNLLLFIFLIEGTVKLKDLSYLSIAALFGIIFFLFRDNNSVVALDYLQHLTVVNRMDSISIMCLLPGQCSNLFLQHGYTTFYHTILGFLTRFSNESATSFFYTLDLVFPIFIGSMTYSLLLKHFKKIGLALIGAIVFIFTFNNGSYDSVFFLPQSFAFLLFLNFLFEKKLKVTTAILASILMIASHFVIGAFLSILLLTKLIFSSLKKQQQIFVTKVATVTVVFFFLANLGGLSVEKLIQFEQLGKLGGLTNSYFPYNLLDLFNVLGFLWIPMLFAIFKMKGRESRTFYLLLIVSLISYLLAPTYANKFLIGVGLYGAFLLVSLLVDAKFTKLWTYYLGLFTLLISLTNYITGFDAYLSFYKLDTEKVNAVTQTDLEISNEIENKKVDCLIVSDPLTQLNIAALADKDSLYGQYMDINSREHLYNLVNAPLKRDLDVLIKEARALGANNLCIINTPRLQSSVIRQDKGWTTYLYNNPTDSSFLPLNDDLNNFMIENGFTPIFLTDSYTLWQRAL